MSILEVKGVRKVYVPRFGGSQVEALKNVTFSVEEGEYVSIMGESGSGKTTLLNILAALDRMSMPQDMQIQVCDLLSSCYLRWGTAAFAIGLRLGLSLMQDCSGRRLRI